MSIFKGQTLLTITLNTGQDISAGSTFEIHYIKPSQARGAWTASLSGLNSIQYSIQSGDIDESGAWKIQSHVVISGNEVKGEIVNMRVLEPLYVA